jgi:hypothetical protein
MSEEEEVEETQRRRAKALAASLPGADAIYRDKGIVVRVRIREVRVDDWGATISAEVVPAKGLVGPPTLRDFSGAWQVLSVGLDSMSAAYAGWSLYSDPELVADIVTFAETLGSESDYLKLSKRIHDWHERARSTSGDAGD